MAERNVLIIEPDGAFAAELRGALEPYGFGIEILKDGNEVLQRPRDPMPDLVLLCVEPKNVGYAICNKLKKNNAWKSTPIVLMSAEATQDTFDQHRKLKTHADEYLIKPFPIEDLLGKVDQLIGLGDLVTSGQSDESMEIPIDNVEAVEEIALEDDDLAVAEEGDEAPAVAAQHPEFTGEEPTTITMDEDLDAEAAAAFASLSNSSQPQALGAQAAVAQVAAYEPMREPEPEPPSIKQRGRQLSAALAEFEQRSTAVEEPAVPQEALDVGLDQVQQPSQDDAYVRELQDRVRALEDERDRYKRELDDARRAPAARAETQEFSREREFLNLREIINRKEKEILDLKDDLDSKDRQILDHKDKIRELERKGRDLDEKILGFEQQLLGANERTAAMGHEIEDTKRKAADDKAAGQKEIDRVRGEAARQLQQAKDLSEKEKTQLRTDHQKASEKQRGDHEKALAALRDEHAGEVAALHEAQEAAMADRDTQLERALADAKKHEQEELQQADQRRLADLGVAEEKRKADLAAADERRQRELAAQAEEHKQDLERQADQHRGEMVRVEREHAAALAAQHEEFQAQMAAAAEKQRAEIEALNAKHKTATEELTESFEGQIAELKREHAEKVEEQEQAHRDLKSGMEQRHKAQQEELKNKHATEVAALSDELAQRDQELSAARTQIGKLENELLEAMGKGEDLEKRLQTALADIDSRNGRISDMGQQIEELERQNAGFQDQVLKAFGKIKNDGKLAEKARKALAIAAALLEEQMSAPADGTAAQEEKTT
jgi:CheY-like chemotaxis protein